MIKFDKPVKCNFCANSYCIAFPNYQAAMRGYQGYLCASSVLELEDGRIVIVCSYGSIYDGHVYLFLDVDGEANAFVHKDICDSCIAELHRKKDIKILLRDYIADPYLKFKSKDPEQLTTHGA